jgi:hypothetical protein
MPNRDPAKAGAPQGHRKLFVVFRSQLKKRSISMDKIIKISLCLFIVILIAFTSVVTYQVATETAYLNSLSSTYSYKFTITTDSKLSNVTFFIPVPADPWGYSPIVAGYSSGNIAGIPDDWTVTLYDTGKATMVKVVTLAISPPAGTSASNPFNLTLFSDMKSGAIINTREPVNNSAMFYPVRNLKPVTCSAEVPAGKGAPQCYQYITSLYADYEAAPDASVIVTSTIIGKNSWKIFESGSNEYATAANLQMTGSRHGWETMTGTLTTGIGRYDTPLPST